MVATFISGRTGLLDFNTAIEITCSGFGRLEMLEGGLACLVAYREGVIDERLGLQPQICGRVFLPRAALVGVTDLIDRVGIKSVAHRIALARPANRP